MMHGQQNMKPKLSAESWNHQKQGDRNHDSRSVRQTIRQMFVLGTEGSELKTEKNDGKNI
jgi:hypothetical protein